VILTILNIRYFIYGHLTKIPLPPINGTVIPLAPRPTAHSLARQNGWFGNFVKIQPRLYEVYSTL